MVVNSINFKLPVNKYGGKQKDETLKKFKGKQVNIFQKRVSGGLYSYHNIKPKVYKSQKRKYHSK